jgi:hypothetical protein
MGLRSFLDDEGRRLVIHEDGRQIVEQLNRHKLRGSRVTGHHFIRGGQIVQFDSEHFLVGSLEARWCGRPQGGTI